MKKRDSVYLFSFAVVFLLVISTCYAANDTTNNTASTSSSTDPFAASYTCLKNQIDSRTYSALTEEELALSLLALSSDSAKQKAIVDELESRKSSSSCWPASGCRLKETSMVMLAYIHINKNVDEIKNWLLSQTGTTADLTWYLQVETNNQSECTLTVNNASKKIVISENKQLSGNPGTCFRLAYNNYWLEVVDDCYEKDIKISCNTDFYTSTFYKRKSGSIYYVSSTTQSSAPGGETNHKIESLCFKQGGSCNFEGSLWATVAVNKKDSSIKDKVLPYLLTLATDSGNKKYLPSAFLYAITGFDEYYSELTSLQNSKGYWQASDAAKRYYDTAVALFGLAGQTDSEQYSSAKEYLLDPSVMQNGCWNGNNIRDTAFLLYDLDPKSAVTTTTNTMAKCSDYSDQGYSCTSPTECENINGTELPNFNCYGALVCCDKTAQIAPTCSEQNGIKCSFGEECSTDNFVEASDSDLCCVGTGSECIPKVSPPLEDECKLEGYECLISCDPDVQEQKSFDCTEGVCCAEKTPEEEGSSLWWLWLLIILIILVILAIIFRNQIKMWYFKTTNKFSKQPMPPQQPYSMPPRPGMPPAPMRPMPPRPMQGRPMLPPRPGMPPRPFPRQDELDATLNKLKDMSKK